jgi:hypothetical protein
MASIDQIRQFGLREAFEEALTEPSRGHAPVVRLLNDGVAHVLAERAQLTVFSGGPGALAPGEVVVGHTAGTGSALAVLRHDGSLLPEVLAELGRLITHVSDPFPEAGASAFPSGAGRDAFNKSTLGRVATQLLLEALGRAGPEAAAVSRELTDAMKSLTDASDHLAAAAGHFDTLSSDGPLTPAQGMLASAANALPVIPSLLVGWLLESSPSHKERLEKFWAAERPHAVTASLADLSITLSRILASLLLDQPWGKSVQAFAEEIAHRAGQELADLVVTTTDIFSATNAVAGGGPLSGDTGRRLRQFARAELEHTYRFEVPSGPPSPTELPPRLSRLIRFPEPSADLTPPGSSGAYGAALAAVDLL